MSFCSGTMWKGKVLVVNNIAQLNYVIMDGIIVIAT